MLYSNGLTYCQMQDCVRSLRQDVEMGRHILSSKYPCTLAAMVSGLAPGPEVQQAQALPTTVPRLGGDRH